MYNLETNCLYPSSLKNDREKRIKKINMNLFRELADSYRTYDGRKLIRATDVIHEYGKRTGYTMTRNQYNYAARKIHDEDELIRREANGQSVISNAP